MKKVLLGLSFCVLIFSSCERKNYVYSNATLNRPYEYDPAWDFRGYPPQATDETYRRYDPEREEDVVKNIKDKGLKKN